LRYILDTLAKLLAIVSQAEGKQWWSYQLQGRIPTQLRILLLKIA